MRAMIGPRILPAAVCIAATFVLSAPAAAQSVADFYRGKTISLYVAFPPGGGFDIYARVVAPYYSRHIPGNPQIVVKNMEGGSGVRAASYMPTTPPQEGPRSASSSIRSRSGRSWAA